MATWLRLSGIATYHLAPDDFATQRIVRTACGIWIDPAAVHSSLVDGLPEDERVCRRCRICWESWSSEMLTRFSRGTAA